MRFYLQRNQDAILIDAFRMSCNMQNHFWNFYAWLDFLA